MSTTVEYVLVPTMLAVRTACERRQVVEIALEGPGKGTATPMQLDGPPDDPPRIILTLDGEEKHLTAVCNVIIDRGLAESQGIEVVKLAASASKIQQPCDVGPMYKVLKQALKGDPPLADCPYRHELTRLLAPLESASRKTFQAFIELLPIVLNKSFTRWNVLRGWNSSGLWPFNLDVMLAKCTSWSSLGRHQQTSVRRELDWLVEQTYLHGEAREEAFKKCFVDTFDELRPTRQKPDKDPDSTSTTKAARKQKPLDDRVIQYRRAVWMNHDAITKERARRQTAKEDAAEKKAKSAEAKTGKAAAGPASSPTATTTKKRERKSAAAAPRGRKATRTDDSTVCNNPECGAEEESDGVPFDVCCACGLPFCNELACQECRAAHEYMCE
jgi:hypothetical protein